MTDRPRRWDDCNGDPCTCPKPLEFGRGYDRGIAMAYRGQQRNVDAAVVQAVIGLPARLKAHRAAHNLSQREIAKRAGVSFATISRIENGEDYVVSNLIALAAYLDGAR